MDLQLQAFAQHEMRQFSQNGKPSGVRSAIGPTPSIEVLEFAWRKYGSRLQFEGIKVLEIGEDIVPFDGRMAGAMSIPLELRERIMDHGATETLFRLAREDLLGASYYEGSRAREIRTEDELGMAEQSLIDKLGLFHDGLLDRLFHRKLSKVITASLLPVEAVAPIHITALSVFTGILAGPLLASTPRVAAAAPLAAGNAVIIKPPEQASLSALRLAEIIGDMLPPGVFSVLPGDADAGAALVSHPDVAMVGLVGSVATGRAVMKMAADTLKPVQLELGGKNACHWFCFRPDTTSSGKFDFG